MKRLLAILLIPFIATAADQTGAGTDDLIQAWYDNPTTVEGNTYYITAGSHSVDAQISFEQDKGVSIIGLPGAVIIDDLVTKNHMFYFGAPTDPNVRFRFSNFTVSPGVGASVLNNAIFLSTGRGFFEIDNITDTGADRKFYKGAGSQLGVIHSNEITLNPTGSDSEFHFFLDEYGWETHGVDAEWGDGSWAVPIDPGGPTAVYLEDNNLIQNIPGQLGKVKISDYYGGCRVVWRKNVVQDSNWASHGTGDGSGNMRGPVKVEYYWNEVTYTNPFSLNAINCRGGWFIHCQNTYNANVTNIMSLHQYLYNSQHGKFGQSDGGNEWDNNDLTDGAGTPGGAGDGVFEAGTATSGTMPDTLVDSSKSWDPSDGGEWVGYVVRVTTPNTFDWPRGYIASNIESNTSNTLLVSGYSNTTPGINNAGQPASAAPALAFNDADPDTITRSDGLSFLVDDGFIDYGLRVLISGADEAGNNGTFVTTSVTASTITLDPSVELTADASDANAILKMIKWGANNPNRDKDFRVGATYEIRRVDLSLDQVGASMSDIVRRAATGAIYNVLAKDQDSKVADGSDAGSPLFFPDGARIRVPVNQTVYPAYSFANVHPGTIVGAHSVESPVLGDYHFFLDTATHEPPTVFDGTTGVGVGTLAQMNAITPTLLNVGWFADDQGGDMNGDGDPDGEFYIWNGSSWELYWEPYTYPHPMRSDEGGGPDPPAPAPGSTAVNVTTVETVVGP